MKYPFLFLFVFVLLATFIFVMLGVAATAEVKGSVGRKGLPAD